MEAVRFPVAECHHCRTISTRWTRWHSDITIITTVPTCRRRSAT